jgi:hypothetical protein
MDYSENGVTMFNGQNGLKYEMWIRRMIVFLQAHGHYIWLSVVTGYFYRHMDIIFGYQWLHDMIVKKGKRLQPRRN